MAAAALAAQAGCGGGGGPAATTASGLGGASGPTSVRSDAQAARFLAQASLGAPRADIAAVRALGYAGWMEAQFALPTSTSHVDWLTAAGYAAEAYRNSTAGLDNTLWRKLLSSPDTLRQRMVLALADILVVSVLGISVPFVQFAVARYVDLLEANAFGNFRQLLHDATLSTAMGCFLTYRGNAKAGPQGSQPDENYARELMQLFTIGLVQLRDDGTPVPGHPETYQQEDVSGLARVFTGWDLDTAAVGSPPPAAVHSRPMVQVAGRYETGSKTFLGTTIPAGTAAATALDTALDTLFEHPNLPPFISRQLIQRLVTSNPAPAYVARVAAVFRNNGSGVRGDLRAVLAAILLDEQARDAAHAADPLFGKVREPVLRFVHWARTFGATSPSGTWAIGDLSNPGTRLGQSPWRSPSVFNFFRPGYVPPGSAVARAGLVAPELQLVNESSTTGYLNFMQGAVAGSGIGDVRADDRPLLALAADAQALLDETNTLLAAGHLSDATLSAAVAAVETIDAFTDAGRRNRVHAAVLLTLAAPECVVQK